MDSPKNENDIRCSVCWGLFNLEETTRSGKEGCPNCGTIIPPYMLKYEIGFQMNWQELRILATYAKRWMKTFKMDIRGNRDMAQALANIMHKLSHYRPRGANGIIETADDEPMEKPQPIRSPYFQQEGPDLDGMKF